MLAYEVIPMELYRRCRWASSSAPLATVSPAVLDKLNHKMDWTLHELSFISWNFMCCLLLFFAIFLLCFIVAHNSWHNFSLLLILWFLLQGRWTDSPHTVGRFVGIFFRGEIASLCMPAPRAWGCYLVSSLTMCFVVVRASLLSIIAGVSGELLLSDHDALDCSRCAYKFRAHIEQLRPGHLGNELEYAGARGHRQGIWVDQECHYPEVILHKVLHFAR